MGCFCSNIHSNSVSLRSGIQSVHTSISTDNASFSFSLPNEDFFLIPKNYCIEVSQLRDILTSDPVLWRNYSNFLFQMNQNFLKKIASITWFLKQEKPEKESPNIKNSNEDSSMGNHVTNIPYIMSEMSLSQSLTKEVFYEDFPFMKMNSCQMFQTKLVIEVESLFLTNKFLAKYSNLENPCIEIEIHSFKDMEGSDAYEAANNNDNNNDPEIKKITTSKIAGLKTKRSIYWGDIFSEEILNISNFDQGFFSVCLFFHVKNSQKKKMVGEKYIFDFSELGNQLIMEKALAIKEDNDQVLCYLLFKCQLIFDIMGLLLFWKNDLEVKSEVAKRIILRSQKTNSVFLMPKKKHNSLIFSERKLKEDLLNKMDSFHKIFNSTFNQSLRNERISFKEAIKRTFASKMIDSMISQESALLNQSIYYDNKYFLA